MKKVKKCSVCNVVRPVSEFKRKRKTYKSCNKCSRYKHKYALSKKMVKPSMALNRIFTSHNKTLPAQFHQKYGHIKKLEWELINEIYQHMKNNIDK